MLGIVDSEASRTGTGRYQRSTCAQRAAQVTTDSAQAPWDLRSVEAPGDRNPTSNPSIANTFHRCAHQCATLPTRLLEGQGVAACSTLRWRTTLDVPPRDACPAY